MNDSFFDSVLNSVRRAWQGPRTSSESVDYRDRISVATWPVVVGLALSLFVALPTVEFSFVAFGSPATIPVTGTLLIAFALAVLAASGAESVVSAHPHFATAAQRSRGRTWPFWALPMAMTIIMTMLLPLLPTPLIQVLGLLLAAVLMILVSFSLYVTVEPGQQGFRRARLALNILTYAAAVVLFLFVYQTRARSLVSATLVAVTAMLLAIELLRTNTSSTIAIIGYGAIVGILLGEVTWALNYWPLPNLTGGLLLLLIFYMAVSFAQAGLQKRLTRASPWNCWSSPSSHSSSSLSSAPASPSYRLTCQLLNAKPRYDVCPFCEPTALVRIHATRGKAKGRSRARARRMPGM